MLKKVFLWMLVPFSLMSCDWIGTGKKFEFESITIEQIENNCTDSDNCCVVSLNYLKSTKPKLFAKQFNNTIQSRLLSLLQPENQESDQNYSLDKAIDDYFLGYEDVKKIFPETPAYEINVVDSLLFANDTLVSVMSSVYSYSGGAHGYNSVTFLNFDNSGRLYSNEELFTDKNSVKKVAEKYFRRKEKIGQYESFEERGFWFEDDKFSLSENIGFEKDSLILYYNPYEIAPYSEGVKVVKIPIQEIKEWIFYTK